MNGCKMRTHGGGPSAKTREKTAALSGGRFPIFDEKSAASALKLRGHAGSKESRSKVIRKAARFLPAAAKAAKQADKE